MNGISLLSILLGDPFFHSPPLPDCLTLPDVTESLCLTSADVTGLRGPSSGESSETADTGE